MIFLSFVDGVAGAAVLVPLDHVISIEDQGGTTMVQTREHQFTVPAAFYHVRRQLERASITPTLPPIYIMEL